MEIKTKLIRREPTPNSGFANGYIGVPQDHPWFGKPWQDLDIDVHGGVTWSKDRLPNEDPDGLWWIGFDTAHHEDGPHLDELFCQNEVERMKSQALAAV